MLADLRFAFRQLIKAPGFATVAVIALALGIATATTMFTFFDALLVRPLPFLRDETTLLNIRSVDTRNRALDMAVSVPDFQDIRRQATTLAGALTVWNRTYILGGGDRPERILGAWITVDGFQTLGVQPMLGRLFRPDEDKSDNPNVVILGYATWKNLFGGRSDVIGQTITLNEQPATVVGVMPEGFRFPEVCDLWQPFPLSFGLDEKKRGDHSWPFYARMKPGVTVEQVQAELDTLAARLAQAHPVTNTGFGFRALLIREEATRDLKLQLQLMLGAVLAVLLIACGNVANLLLARAATRAREVAVRSALGAGRGRIVRQVLTESLVLGGIGGLAAMLLASWELDFVLGFIPIEIPFWVRFDPDWRIFGFALAATIGSSVLFGLFPAWQVSRADIVTELKEGGRSGVGSSSGRRLRKILVVLQMALALVLLVVAGLTLRSFLHVQRTDTGIDAGHVLTFRTGIPPTMVADEKAAAPFFEKVLTQLKTIPGVESAGFLSYLPVSEGSEVRTFLPEGTAEPKSILDWPLAILRVATPGAFSALRIPLRAGRLFDAHDGVDTTPVALVDEALARRYYPHGDAIGKRITLDDAGPKRQWLTIVGIVGAVRQNPADADFSPGVWRPFAQAPDNFASAVVRVEGDPARYVAAARDAVLSVRSDIPIYYPDAMTRVVQKTLWKPRFFGGLFAGFAGIALLLAAIGIYGVTAYSVSQRTQEIGVRMALGAQPHTVITMVVSEGAQLVVVGLVIGFAAAWAVAQLLAGMLHGIDPHDPPTFAAVPLLLSAVALVACYVPSRRATRIDPIVALRTE